MDTEKYLRVQIKEKFPEIEEFLENSSACLRIPVYRELFINRIEDCAVFWLAEEQGQVQGLAGSNTQGDVLFLIPDSGEAMGELLKAAEAYGMEQKREKIRIAVPSELFLPMEKRKYKLSQSLQDTQTGFVNMEKRLPRPFSGQRSLEGKLSGGSWAAVAVITVILIAVALGLSRILEAIMGML